MAGTSHSLSHTWATNCSVLAEAWKYWFPTGINIPATKTRPPVAKQCGQCARALKVDQQLERTSQLFTTMVNKCCRNGLHGNVSPEGISRHRFPMNDMKSRWLRAIPRKKNWVPNKNSVACSLHCDDSDFVTDRADSSIIRGIKREKLTKMSPMVDTVPSVFPGLPSYLSKDKPPKLF